jgi:trans-2,3-dihydro-3-hydroxyanthranilate isomerase
MPRKLHIVDVFTDRPCTGNALAVVLGAAGLTARQMQAFAREMNFAETTFVTAAEPVAGAWPVRIFTTQRELPFAGHPVLGTAHVLRSEMAGAKTQRILLDLPSGRVPVAVEREGRQELYWMRHPVATVGGRLNRRQAAQVLGLAPSDIDAKHPSLEILAGLGYIVIPVRTRAALARASLDVAALDKVAAGFDSRAVLAFAKGASAARNDYTVRVFFDYFGEAEDAATGSGNACLAAWLVESGYCGDDAVDVRIEQGAHLGRPSLLHLRGIRTSRGVEVRVGGGVVDVVRGSIVATRYG